MKSFKTPMAALKAFKGVATSKVLPILTSALVDGEWLTIDNLSTVVRIKHGWPVASQPYLIEVSDLLALMAGEGIASLDVGRECVLTSKGRVITVVIDVDDFPMVPYKLLKGPLGIIKEIGYIAPEDAVIMNKAYGIASKDELRPAMCQVVINDNQVVATDGHKLFCRNLVGDIKGGYIPFPAVTRVSSPIIPGKVTLYMEVYEVNGGRDTSTSVALEALRVADVVDLNESIDILSRVWVEIKDEDGDLEVASRWSMVKYPNYKVVIPDVKNAAISTVINPKELSDLVKAILPSTNPHSNVIEFDFENGVIVGRDLDRGSELKLDMPDSIKHPNVLAGYMDNIAFNGKGLCLLLDMYNGHSQLAMNLHAPNKAATFNGSLIMPVMLAPKD